MKANLVCPMCGEQLAIATTTSATAPGALVVQVVMPRATEDHLAAHWN